MTEQWAFEIVLDSPASLSDLLSTWVERIRDLVTFCADRPSAVTGVRVGGPATLVPSASGHRLAQVHLPWIPAAATEVRRLHHDEPILSIPANPQEFGALMAKWISVRDDLAVVLDLHFASDYAGFVYGETRFMNAVQAIEAYHRRRCAQRPDDMDLSRRDRAIEACPADVRPWLQDKLAHAHEPGLRRRVRELLSFAGAAIAPLAQSRRRRDQLIEQIVDARNRLTHWDPAKPTLLDGRQLRALSGFLRVLLTACVLRELGLSEAEAAEALSANRRFKFELSQVASA